MGSNETSAISASCILFFCIFLLVPANSASTSVEGESEAPHLEASIVHGQLDQNIPSAIAVVLRNNASASAGAYGRETDPASARGIVAELLIDDERIRVLSGPQLAGSLAPGENATVEYMALAEGAEVGIYPARLNFSYSWIEEVSISGDDNAPDVIFDYGEGHEELPLAIRVVVGPRIEIKEVRGNALPGEDANLEVIVENSGDEPAFGLRMETRPVPPLTLITDEKEQTRSDPGKEVNLKPGDSATIDFALSTDANATEGYHPVPATISYMVSPLGHDGDIIGWGSERKDDIAILVVVREESYLEAWIFLLICLFVIIILAASYVYFQRNGSGSPYRKRRLRKSLKD